MLVLRRVAPFDVTQGRVGVDDAVVAKVFKCHQVLRLPQSVHPPSAEGQGAEILLDDVEQMLGLLQSGVEMKRIKHQAVNFLTHLNPGYDINYNAPRVTISKPPTDTAKRKKIQQDNIYVVS